MVIDALAVFRLSRLLAQDEFPPVKRFRHAVQDRWPTVGQRLCTADGWRIDTTECTASRGRVRVDVTGGVVGNEAAFVAEAHPIGYLIGCVHCVSPWVAAVVLAARRWVPGAWGPVAKILAGSAVAGLASSATGP